MLDFLFMKNQKDKETKSVERLHDDYRRQHIKEQQEEEEYLRIQTTGGGAET